MTLWLTGLPASGKSTLAGLLRDHFDAVGRQALVLDGDVLRAGLSADLGFSPADRAEQARRTTQVALLLHDAGLVAIVALVSPSAAAREVARLAHGDRPFIEVFVDCAAEVCRTRDPKGMWARAARGEIDAFTGVSAPYERPQNPEIAVRTDQATAAECLTQIVARLDSLQ